MFEIGSESSQIRRHITRMICPQGEDVQIVSIGIAPTRCGLSAILDIRISFLHLYERRWNVYNGITQCRGAVV